MRAFTVSLWACIWTSALTTSTDGLYSLIERRLPSHRGKIKLHLEAANNSTAAANDNYAISTASNGSILVSGSSLSALSAGLRRYLSDEAQIDIYWFIGSQLSEAPPSLLRKVVQSRGRVLCLGGTSSIP